VVDVVGKVRHPGVYRLAGGTRVDDALRAAGGAVPGVDLTRVNLARKLADGEQIAIGIAGAGTATGVGSAVGNGDGGSASGDPAAGSADGNGSPAGSALVDLNTATEAQLDALPGVGPVLAQHITEWRDAHGRFASVDQLQSVSGIGDAKFADLKGLVTVS
jgi:competence protein ComEA